MSTMSLPTRTLLVALVVTLSLVTSLATFTNSSSSLHFKQRRGIRGVSLLPASKADPSTSTSATRPVPFQHHRTLMKEHNFFAPLTCNSPVCKVKRSTWNAEGYKPTSGTVVIPCGHCVTLDYQAPSGKANTLVLPHGLDVQGTLTIAGATYRNRPLTIVTPYVRVQGKLIMETFLNLVGATPNVKIVLTDGNSGGPASPTAFFPAGNNAFACSEFPSGNPTPCTVGNKPIVVAGGQLDVRGLPQGCSTWVKLHDVPKLTKLPNPSKFSVVAPRHSNIFCRGSTMTLMQQSFNRGSPFINEWSAYSSGQIATAGGSLVSTNRVNDGKDGIAWDLGRLRGCLVPYTTYLFSFRVRFLSNMPTGTPSACVQTGKNCLRVTSVARFASGSIANNKGMERRVDSFSFGEWNTFHTSFAFGPDELGPNAESHKLVVAGPKVDVAVEIDDVSFGLPPPSLYPNPADVCGGNLIRNGDAKASTVDPYPIDIAGNGKLSVNVDLFQTNFFRMQKRTSAADSIAHDLDAPGCIVPGGRYSAYAKVRMVSPRAVRTLMTFRVAYSDGSTSRTVVTECPASMNAWVDCSATFTVGFDYSADIAESVRFQFETMDGSNADMDITNWRVEFLDVTQPEIVVQSNGVQGCWGNGAEVLVTSATTDFKSAQVRRLVADPVPYANGLVRLRLDGYVPPSVTNLDGDGFAVEVALLSRNIVFEGAPDRSDSLMGAHLMVLGTRRVAQYLEGVEFRNFGRQGEIGRYPIHLHMSGDVLGTVVTKNSIRNSNQRGVVVHGTHNATVSWNVAHETMGHTFVLEDGGELDNQFVGNLGASTTRTFRVVRASETDNTIPSTFWISNPANTWIGNVGAGGEGSGVWFELQDSVRSPSSLLATSAGMAPRKLALKLFSNNVVHSYGQHGLRTYPIGFFPPKQAVFHNTMSYKNKPAGVFFHNSYDLKLQGGVLADNGIQADFDRADNIVVSGTHVIGSTARFNEIAASDLVRLGHPQNIVGLQLHNFADPSRAGATIVNVRFSGFANALSNTAAIIEVDGDALSKHFDYWTTLQGVQITDGFGPAAFDFRRAAAAGLSDIVLTDVDSSMKPVGSNAVGASSIISSSAAMKAFINEAGTCHDFSGLGYLYCRQTCFRVVTFATSPAETDRYVLRVTTKTTPRQTFDFSGVYNYETETISGMSPEQRNTWMKKHRYFAPPLPAGSYTAQFIDSRNGQPVWPKFVERTDEHSACSPAVSIESVKLVTGAPSLAQCRELVENGDMERSNTFFPHWLHHETGIELADGAGIGRSNAIADTDYRASMAYIGQFVDTRCLDAGRRYTIRAFVKLVNPRSKAAVRCSTADKTCPIIQLRIRVAADMYGRSFTDELVNVPSTFLNSAENGWNLLQGQVTIDARVAGAASVAVVVRRSLANVKMYLDNVSMSLS